MGTSTHARSDATPATWLVGHDGSDAAQHGADWALAQAVEREVEIAVVRTWQIPALDLPLPVDSIEQFAPLNVSEGFDDFAARAAEAGVEVTQRVVRGATAIALIEQSANAALLILGSRGHGGFRRLLLGSTSAQCATHAVVPTVVVPPAATCDGPMRRIIVGVDGSERSLTALDWAVDFAPADGEVTVVQAWMPSRSGYVAVVEHYTSERADAGVRFDELLDEYEARTGRRFVRRFVFADPSTALLAASADADLLVVGQRGHSGLSGVILGSVTMHVLHHSTVPVAVVPADD